MLPPRALTTLPRLFTTLHREALVSLLVGIPAIGYVLATNQTASNGLIVLHAALLGALTPSSVTILELALPRPARPGLLGVLRDLAVRTAGLALATLGTVAGIAALTPLTLRALVGGPLLVALVPVYLAYALAALAVQWVALREHALRADANETRARQAALAARIRPHFLFNALNCIEELTDTDPPAARVAVGRLARLLRSVLQASSSPAARLEDEARLVDDYLGIEQIRFGSRFSYELQIDPEVALCELPATVLLTLAENAIKHGVEATRGPARVCLRARSAPGGAVRIQLTSPCATVPSVRAEQGTGYGLADVRERLALAVGGRATLALRTEGAETHVELVLPG